MHSEPESPVSIIHSSHYDNCTNLIHFPKECIQRERAVALLTKSASFERQFFPTFFASEDGQMSFFSSINKTVTSSDFCWPDWEKALNVLKLNELRL